MKFFFICLFLTVLSCGNNHSRNRINYLDQVGPKENPLVFAPNIISKQGRFEMGFTMSSDGNRMAFGVFDETIATNTCIYFLEYTNEKWSNPNKISLPENINTFFPMFGPEKDEFYFAKSINGAETDILRATFLDSKIKSTQALDSIINSDMREAGHGKGKSGVFYFTTNRGRNNGDIYKSYPDEKGNYSSVQKVKELSSEVDEESLFLSPDENYIIIQAWKNEFNSKHDLYISYRTKKGVWTGPKRLNTNINSQEIEQRPFVSPDNKFLFFSRMSITRKNDQDIYDSDIYWVSTKSVFCPYVYNTQIESALKYREEFEIEFPKDIFKDVDDTQLTFKLSLEDNSETPKWMNFDSKNLILSGIWNTKEALNLKLTATDIYGNSEEFNFELGEKSN